MALTGRQDLRRPFTVVWPLQLLGLPICPEARAGWAADDGLPTTPPTEKEPVSRSPIGTTRR